MNYRSLPQLIDQVWAWSAELPRDLDLVVGIPRDGLLVANLLALYRNVAVTTLDGLLAGTVLGTGRRYRGDLAPGSSGLKVLVVDDSLWEGCTMAAVKERIAAAGLPHQVYYGAVYVRPGYEDRVDFHRESVAAPRLFEWNIMHPSILRESCLDIDGVLCMDPSRRENDDGPLYRSFLASARSFRIPAHPVGWLVTSRLEKYRAETEEWLRRQGVRYDHLIMLDLPSAATRRDAKTHAAFKAEVYARTPAKLFFESERSQAVRIANLALKPVFFVGTMQMIYPDSLPSPRATPRRASGLARHLRGLKRRLVG